jgi:formate dehydrogenase subunit gamma
MRRLIPRGLAALAMALGLWTSGLAQTAPTAVPDAAAKGPPAGFVAPAEPKADDNNAQRAKSQPGNNAPTWRAVANSGNQPGVVNLPGAEQGVLVQSFVQYPGSRLTTAGEAWRQVRNQWIIPYGGALLVIAVLALAIFYWRRGPLGGHEANTGRKIERFTPFERALHWTNAFSFVVLAVSGIVLAFGKFFLLPVLGGTLFGWLSYLLKNLHNFVGPLFAVSLLIMVISFAKDNLPRAADLTWLRNAGGLFGGSEVPSHRLNAGEKIMFWVGVTVLGLTVVASGLVLDKLVPGWGETRGQMQVAHMVHAIAAVLMMAILAGHIYMGSVGMKDALVGMRTGYVDEGWAKEHHRLWYDDISAGKIPAQRSGTPAGSASAGLMPPVSGA